MSPPNAPAWLVADCSRQGSVRGVAARLSSPCHLWKGEDLYRINFLPRSSYVIVPVEDPGTGIPVVVRLRSVRSASCGTGPDRVARPAHFFNFFFDYTAHSGVIVAVVVGFAEDRMMDMAGRHLQHEPSHITPRAVESSHSLGHPW